MVEYFLTCSRNEIYENWTKWFIEYMIENTSLYKANGISTRGGAGVRILISCSSCIYKQATRDIFSKYYLKIVYFSCLHKKRNNSERTVCVRRFIFLTSYGFIWLWTASCDNIFFFLKKDLKWNKKFLKRQL